MPELDSLKTLLSQVRHNTNYNGLDGLNPLRTLLEKDQDGAVVDFLNAQMPDGQQIEADRATIFMR